MNNSKRMLRLPQVIDKVGLKKTTIYEMIKTGEPRFPEAVKLGSASLWIESEIDVWMDACVEKYRKAG